VRSDRRPFAAILPAVLSAQALLLFLPSCGEPTHSRLDSQASPLRGQAPVEGTIVFYDPKPLGGARRGTKPAPVLITITTRPQRGKIADEPGGIVKGRLEGKAPNREKTERQVREEIFQRAKASSAHMLSPAKFQELWRSLEDCGLFKLPRHRGGIPPEDKPSIRMSAEGRTWILLRPTDAPAQDLPGMDELASIKDVWGRAKLLIVGATP